MGPTVIFIRHAQALHNIDKNYELRDPELSELGIEQCKELRENLMQLPVILQAGNNVAILASAMRRTLQTALYTLDFLHEKGVGIEASALWQENSAKPCDTGSPVKDLEAEFPSVDFDHVDPVWPDKTSRAGARYAYTKTAILARGESCIEAIRARPEQVIVVVSHSGFLRTALAGRWFFNADYRIFDIDGLGELKLQECTLAGGLGKSRIEPVELGTGLPDE